tara:strand:- start:451 stop:834 length:384 start_codon:yes stop_codon:yes gene_type:complete
MKKLIIILSFIFASKTSFGQFVKAGYFYELSKLWSIDSVSVKQLLDTYKLDISKLDTVQYFNQFKLNLKLHKNFTNDTYVYILNKKTGAVTMKYINTVMPYPKLNKYVMVICFDLNLDEKIINIVVF